MFFIITFLLVLSLNSVTTPQILSDLTTYLLNLSDPQSQMQKSDLLDALSAHPRFESSFFAFTLLSDFLKTNSPETLPLFEKLHSDLLYLDSVRTLIFPIFSQLQPFYTKKNCSPEMVYNNLFLGQHPPFSSELPLSPTDKDLFLNLWTAYQNIILEQFPTPLRSLSSPSFRHLEFQPESLMAKRIICQEHLQSIHEIAQHSSTDDTNPLTDWHRLSGQFIDHHYRNEIAKKWIDLRLVETTQTIHRETRASLRILGQHDLSQNIPVTPDLLLDFTTSEDSLKALYLYLRHHNILNQAGCLPPSGQDNPIFLELRSRHAFPPSFILFIEENWKKTFDAVIEALKQSPTLTESALLNNAQPLSNQPLVLFSLFLPHVLKALSSSSLITYNSQNQTLTLSSTLKTKSIRDDLAPTIVSHFKDGIRTSSLSVLPQVILLSQGAEDHPFYREDLPAFSSDQVAKTFKTLESFSEDVFKKLESSPVGHEVTLIDVQRLLFHYILHNDEEQLRIFFQSFLSLDDYRTLQKQLHALSPQDRYHMLYRFSLRTHHHTFSDFDPQAVLQLPFSGVCEQNHAQLQYQMQKLREALPRILETQT